jgi:hypothetical protein
VFLRQLQMGCVTINRDDSRRTESPEELNGEESKTADADHHGSRTGNKRRQRQLHRGVGGEACVRKRCGEDRIKIAHGNAEARINNNVFGKTTIESDAGSIESRNVVAEVLFSAAAWGTVSATSPHGNHGDRFASLEANNALSDFRHPTGNFVAQREGRRGMPLVELRFGFPHYGDVRVTQPASTYLNE